MQCPVTQFFRAENVSLLQLVGARDCKYRGHTKLFDAMVVISVPAVFF
jgi:glycine cleavage system regulatory protein